MARKYPVSKYATHNTEPSLTEQEHKDSCDINVMMKAVNRGYTVRGALHEARYGVDDMNYDRMQHEMTKEQINAHFASLPSDHEFSPEELSLIPKDLIKKFGLKVKKAQAHAAKNNDDKTTMKNAAQPKPESNEPESSDPVKKPSDAR